MSVPEHSVIHGDCLEVMAGMETDSIDALITSPPYAMQRAKQYGGIPEDKYPDWCVSWMKEAKRVVRDAGSVLINIREHVRGGVISDYVHKTRLALRSDGWSERDEFIWVKSTSPPLGHPVRPRRAWDRILWFGVDPQGDVYPKANGNASDRVGIATSEKQVSRGICRAVGKGMRTGIARCTDVVVASPGAVRGDHPAAFPVDLATWMVQLVTQEGGTVLDPFCGSGTTGVACVMAGRGFVGIELDEGYVKIARDRIEKEQPCPTQS